MELIGLKIKHIIRNNRGIALLLTVSVTTILVAATLGGELETRPVGLAHVAAARLTGQRGTHPHGHDLEIRPLVVGRQQRVGVRGALDLGDLHQRFVAQALAGVVVVDVLQVALIEPTSALLDERQLRLEIRRFAQHQTQAVGHHPDADVAGEGEAADAGRPGAGGVVRGMAGLRAAGGQVRRRL